MTCLAGLLRQFIGRGRYEKWIRNRYVGARSGDSISKYCFLIKDGYTGVIVL